MAIATIILYAITIIWWLLLLFLVCLIAYLIKTGITEHKKKQGNNPASTTQCMKPSPTASDEPKAKSENTEEDTRTTIDEKTNDANTNNQKITDQTTNPEAPHTNQSTVDISKEDTVSNIEHTDSNRKRPDSIEKHADANAEHADPPETSQNDTTNQPATSEPTDEHTVQQQENTAKENK